MTAPQNTVQIDPETRRRLVQATGFLASTIGTMILSIAFSAATHPQPKEDAPNTPRQTADLLGEQLSAPGLNADKALVYRHLMLTLPSVTDAQYKNLAGVWNKKAKSLRLPRMNGRDAAFRGKCQALFDHKGDANDIDNCMHRAGTAVWRQSVNTMMLSGFGASLYVFGWRMRRKPG